MQNSQGAAVANEAPARATVHDAPTAPEAPMTLPPIPEREGRLVCRWKSSASASRSSA